MRSDVGRQFLSDLVAADVMECCLQFEGRRVVDRATTDHKSITKSMIAKVVRDALSIRYGLKRSCLAIRIVVTDGVIDVIPANLLTYLLMCGLCVPSIKRCDCSYMVADGTYLYTKSDGGRFTPRQSGESSAIG